MLHINVKLDGYQRPINYCLQEEITFPVSQKAKFVSILLKVLSQASAAH